MSALSLRPKRSVTKIGNVRGWRNQRPEQGQSQDVFQLERVRQEPGIADA